MPESATLPASPRAPAPTVYVTCKMASAILSTYPQRLKLLAREGKIRTLAVPGAFVKYALDDVLALARAAEGGAC